MKKWLALAFITGALTAAVEDNAQLFSPRAIAAANRELAKVKGKTDKDVLILTVNDLAGQRISDAARNAATDRKLNGVVVLISRIPRQLEIIAGRKTGIVFTRIHRQKAVDIFSKGLAKAPDQTLASAVKYFSDTFMTADAILIQPDVHQAPEPVSEKPQSTAFGWVKWVVIGLLGLIIFRVIAHFTAARAAAAGGPTGPTGMGGGGLMTSMLGGIFGAVAGNWIYDRLFSGSHGRSYQPHDKPGHRDDNWRDHDKGDFDSNSGSGGDWGGGDAGDSGGDSGGSSW